MQLFILNQEKKLLVPIDRTVKITKKNKIVHGYDVLGEFENQEECRKVLLEITQCINNIHQFTDENNNVVIAFASISEIYEMPTVEELKRRMKGGE